MENFSNFLFQIICLFAALYRSWCCRVTAWQQGRYRLGANMAALCSGTLTWKQRLKLFRVHCEFGQSVLGSPSAWVPLVSIAYHGSHCQEVTHPRTGIERLHCWTTPSVVKKLIRENCLKKSDISEKSNFTKSDFKKERKTSFQQLQRCHLITPKGCMSGKRWEYGGDMTWKLTFVQSQTLVPIFR